MAKFNKKNTLTKASRSLCSLRAPQQPHIHIDRMHRIPAATNIMAKIDQLTVV